MAQISSGPSVATADKLARGTLRLPDAIAISVSVLAPGMAMLLNVSGVAATSGGSTPLAFLLGGVACLALAFVAIVTVVVILIVDVVTTAKGGGHGQAASAFTFGHSLRGGISGVFYGVILGVTSYIGFETAAILDA